MNDIKSTKKTILIVDDNKDNLRVLAEYIQNGGYEIILSDNGLGACQAAEKYSPNAILLDIMMPGVDGYETCRILKNNSTTENIPVIFVTARSGVESFEEAFNVGASDYITKPFDPEVLIRRLTLHIENTLLKEALQKNNIEFAQLKKMADLGCWFLKMRPYIKNIPEDALLREIPFLYSHSDSFIKNSSVKTPQVEYTSLGTSLEKNKSFMYNQIYKNLLVGVFGSKYHKNYQSISPLTNTLLKKGENFLEPMNFFHSCDRYFSLLNQDSFGENESVDFLGTLQQVIAEKEKNDLGVNIKLTVEPSVVDLSIVGSKKYFGMLVGIFVNNALESQSVSHINITLEKKDILVGLFGVQKEIFPGEYLILSFQNNGKIIPECNKQRIFDPFFSRKNNCVGLGLSYALKIIDLFNANITFCSSHDEKTNFSVFFPI
ncbi:MAG: hybrid sensor histidine kinase/response regulator [Caldisericia bacterium]|nr:hybrid sensor histidine kinase/response regulator [Caldisericia bacterium]